MLGINLTRKDIVTRLQQFQFIICDCNTRILPSHACMYTHLSPVNIVHQSSSVVSIWGRIREMTLFFWLNLLRISCIENNFSNGFERTEPKSFKLNIQDGTHIILRSYPRYLIFNITVALSTRARWNTVELP